MNGIKAGNLPHGKYAARNVGVSIVRADRELELNTSWVNPGDLRERWWGVELSFEPNSMTFLVSPTISKPLLIFTELIQLKRQRILV